MPDLHRKRTAIMRAIVMAKARQSGLPGEVGAEAGSTDLVGYTSLMRSDEDRPFETLRKNREIQTKIIEHFWDTLIKEIGDGMLTSSGLA